MEVTRVFNGYEFIKDEFYRVSDAWIVKDGLEGEKFSSDCKYNGI